MTTSSTTWLDRALAVAGRPPAASRLDWRQAAIAAGFLALYVALDAVSFVQPFGGFSITPWNPQTGLGLAVVLLLGRGYLPALMLAPLVADAAVRGFPAGPLAVPLALAVGAGHGALALVLTSPRIDFDRRLLRTRDLFVLITGAALASALVAISYVAVLAAAGLIARADVTEAAGRLWVGDMIGIAVATPFLLTIAGRTRAAYLDMETALQVAAILTSTAVVATLLPLTENEIFHLLFLPVVWVAVRHGLDGAAAALMLVQCCLMAGMGSMGTADVDLTTQQVLMLVLAVSGLAIGMAVSERQRAERALRLQQDRQARQLRLGSVGELTAGLTHEINQPLSAATTYARLALDLIEDETSPRADARTALEKCSAQLARAAQVVRRQREFIGSGRLELEAVAVEDLIDGALRLIETDVGRQPASIRRDRAVERAMPQVLIDRLQIEQVLINLLRNAIEASTQGPRTDAEITIATSRRGSRVEVGIEDSGPGFADLARARAMEPLASTTPGGLGLGLPLCRTILEAHGARLALDNTPTGAIVRFTLQEAKAREEAGAH